MLAVVGRYLLDAIYIAIFVAVMSGLAYGAHELVAFAKAKSLHPVVILILTTVEITLVAVDAIGVVIASLIFSYRFLWALFRESRTEHGQS